MKQLIILLIFIIGLGILFQHCEPKKEINEAPLLPPESSLVADFSAFAKVPNQKSLLDTVSYMNYKAAYLNVAFWQIVITINLGVPVLAFREAFNHKAQYVDNLKLWEWQYSVKTTEYILAKQKVDTVIYTAKLQGKIISDSIDWKMYLTKTNGNNTFSNFLWYYGMTAISNKGGWWIMNENPFQVQKFLFINWSRQNDSIGMIKYTNIRPNSSGGYLEYGTQLPDENNMNAYYNIMDTANNKTVEIRVNLQTHAGRIKKINETKWSCWDSQLRDVNCE
ncbi:MAG: hypothetical protein ACP5PS_09700 [Bacteroidales bacterium]